MKYTTIENDLPLVIYIIAERAVWNVMEEDERYKGWPPEQCLVKEKEYAPRLVERANYLYDNNEHFRKSLHRKKADPRFTLEMWMEHWVKALLENNGLFTHEKFSNEKSIQR